MRGLNNGNRIHPVGTPLTPSQPKIRQEEGDNGFDICSWILIVISYILIVLTFPVGAFFCINVVHEYQRAVIFRLGRILQGDAKGPGLVFILPCVDNIVKIDLRTTTFDVPPHEILTRDSVTVSVDAVIYSRVIDPIASVTKIDNVYSATQSLVQTTLRNILETKSLHDILTDREVIASSMESRLDKGTSLWGVKVERVEIKDIRLPETMQKSMAAEAEASREARAKVIAAEGEQKASRQLKEAADVISTSPIAVHLRYLQTLAQISAGTSSTIVFPISVELLSLVEQGR